MTTTPTTPIVEELLGNLHLADEFRGIYVTPPINRGLFTGPSLEESYYQYEEMDGLTVRVTWAAIEPAQGTFAFDDVLGPDIDNAVLYQKKITVGVLAANNSPQWVKDGAEPLTFNVRGPQNIVQTIVLPTPWHAFYMIQYVSMWTSLAAWLDDRGALDLVRMVKPALISEDTLEFRLPRVEKTPINAVTVWLAAGYRPSLVLSAYRSVISSVAALFPGKTMSQALMEGNLFPRINDAGEIIRKTAVTVQDDMIEMCRGLLREKFAVMNSALRNSDRPIISIRLEAARQLAVSVGFQTNRFEGFAGAGCQINRLAATIECTPHLYLLLLLGGIRQGAKWIEVWPIDFTKFRPEIAQARIALWQPDLS